MEIGNEKEEGSSFKLALFPGNFKKDMKCRYFRSQIKSESSCIDVASTSEKVDLCRLLSASPSRNRCLEEDSTLHEKRPEELQRSFKSYGQWSGVELKEGLSSLQREGCSELQGVFDIKSDNSSSEDSTEHVLPKKKGVGTGHSNTRESILEESTGYSSIKVRSFEEMPGYYSSQKRHLEVIGHSSRNKRRSNESSYYRSHSSSKFEKVEIDITSFSPKEDDDVFTEDPSSSVFTEDPPNNVFTEDPSSSVFTEDPSNNVFTEDPSSSVFTEDPSSSVFTADPYAYSNVFMEDSSTLRRHFTVSGKDEFHHQSLNNIQEHDHTTREDASCIYLPDMIPSTYDQGIRTPQSIQSQFETSHGYLPGYLWQHNYQQGGMSPVYCVPDRNRVFTFNAPITFEDHSDPELPSPNPILSPSVHFAFPSPGRMLKTIAAMNRLAISPCGIYPCHRIRMPISQMSSANIASIGQNRDQRRALSDSHAFICPVCNKVFSSNENLTKHLATHVHFHAETLEKDNKKKVHCCMICDKSFSRNDMLRRHMRLHTGIKPYTCDVCGKQFSRSDHMKTHKRIHTGEKPYKCSMCPYVACRRDMIKRHFKIHESI